MAIQPLSHLSQFDNNTYLAIDNGLNVCIKAILTQNPIIMPIGHLSNLVSEARSGFRWCDCMQMGVSGLYGAL